METQIGKAEGRWNRDGTWRKDEAVGSSSQKTGRYKNQSSERRHWWVSAFKDGINGKKSHYECDEQPKNGGSGG